MVATLLAAVILTIAQTDLFKILIRTTKNPEIFNC
jgi:hypothetical protein